MLTVYLDRSLNSVAETEIFGQMPEPKTRICWRPAVCNPHRHCFFFGHVSSKTWVYLLPPWVFYAERFWCEFYRPGGVPDASQQKHTGIHLSVTTRTRVWRGRDITPFSIGSLMPVPQGGHQPANAIPLGDYQQRMTWHMDALIGSSSVWFCAVHICGINAK